MYNDRSKRLDYMVGLDLSQDQTVDFNFLVPMLSKAPE